MNKFAVLFLFVLPLIVLVSCTKETHNLNTEFSLDHNRSATVIVGNEEWEIKFLELSEESRCQPNMDCFWAGQVAVKIEIENTTTAELGLHTTIPAVFSYKNHQIHLLEVKYDNDKHFGKENHCSIRLRVE